MKRITIIGGGASGTLLAINLLRHRGEQPIAVNLVEKRDRLGRGVAYSTGDQLHLLNVPAAKMGAFPDDVEHFYRWLGEKGYEYAPSSFVPRKIFGDYLQDLLDRSGDEKSPTANISFYEGEAVNIDISGAPASVMLDSGEIILSDKVILALGNFLPPNPSVKDQSFIAAPKYFQNPWNPMVHGSIEPDDIVLVIGTGLSMVDFVMRFYASDHRGKIYAISTRGLLPAVHRLGYTYSPFFDEISSMTKITDLVKAVRRHIAIASADGSDWRAVIDALRPNTQEIWRRLPTAEKRYFMQHLSRYWNVARHRMPAEAAAVVDALNAAGRLKVMKGRLTNIGVSESRFEVEFATGGVPSRIQCDAIINCIGSESNFERADSPLIKNLIKTGHIRNDPLSLGLDATPDGKMIGRDGTPSRVLLTLGTPLKGVLFESTAIPEIRLQAKNLAAALLSA